MKTVLEIARIVRTTRTQLDRWVADGLLSVGEGAPKRGRRWSLTDAMKAAILVEVGDVASCLPKVVAPHIQSLRGVRDQRAYLIISTGRLGHLIPATPLGAPPVREDHGPKVFVPGHTYSDIVSEGKLAATLRHPDRHFSFVIDLDAVQDRVTKAWAKIG